MGWRAGEEMRLDEDGPRYQRKLGVRNLVFFEIPDFLSEFLEAYSESASISC